MLTETFSVPANEITYVENPWCGGGNAGAAVEVIVGGLELATLVFMDMEEHPDGDVELKGDRYRTMPFKSLTPATDWSDFVGPPPVRQPSMRPFIQRPLRGSKNCPASTRSPTSGLNLTSTVCLVRCLA